MSQIPLRIGKSKKTHPDVDHTVAHSMWEKFVNEWADEPEALEQALPIVNRLGNCSLLEKTFNISKSDKTLKSFMEEVHEFKEGKIVLTNWAKALEIPDIMLEPTDDEVESIIKAIDTRDKSIRADVVKFIKGECGRVDLD